MSSQEFIKGSVLLPWRLITASFLVLLLGALIVQPIHADTLALQTQTEGGVALHGYGMFQAQTQPSQISGWVLEDPNANGAWENSEPGIDGVLVTLHMGPCSNNLLAPIASDITTTSGKYAFNGLGSGVYCVAVDGATLPAHMVATGVGYKRAISLPVSTSLVDQDFFYVSAFVNHRLTVGLTLCTEVAWLHAKAAEYGGSVVSGDDGTCFYVIETPSAQQAALQTDLLDEPDVSFADQDVRVRGEFIPNDPFYSNPSYVYGPQQINAPVAWDTTRGASDLIVAVIDSGIDASHIEFAGRVLPGHDYVNNDNDPSDDNGHGTHVAGILAAGINNGVGIAGIAGNVRILPMKVLDDRNLGYWSNIALAIIDAVDQGAKVINMSLGGTVDSASLRNAVNYATDRNVVVVVAAGNDSSSALYFPASYANVVAIGATDVAGNRWSLSNYGPNVDIMAPGSTVYSAYWQSGQSNLYQFMSGTSMAAPHVAGVAALLFSVNPLLQRQQLVDYLLSTAVDMGTPGYDDYTAHGRVNAGAAVQAAVADLPVIQLAKSVNLTEAAGGDTLTYSITVDHLGGSGLLTNMVISDVIPNGTTYAPASVSAGGVVNNGVISWSLGSMAAPISASNGHGASGATVITLTAVADAYIQAYTTARNTNSGAGAFMQTHVCCTASELQAVSLLRFDLSAIPPGAEIVRSDLRLWETLGTVSRSDRVFRMLTNWSEGNNSAGSGVTWNTRNGSQSWAAGAFSTVDYDAANSLGTINGSGAAGRKIIDVLSAVSAWVGGGAANNGFAIVANTGSQNQYLRYRTREWGTTSERPQLVIEYNVADVNTATFAPNSGEDASDGSFALNNVLLDDEVYDPFVVGGPSLGQTWRWSNIVPAGAPVYEAVLKVNLHEVNLGCGAGQGGFVVLSGDAPIGSFGADELLPSSCATSNQEMTWEVNLFAAGVDTAAEINSLGVRLWWSEQAGSAVNKVDQVSLRVTYLQSGANTATSLAAEPLFVQPGELFTVTMTLSATQTMANVTPSPPVVVGSNDVQIVLVDGPLPASASVGSGGATFRWHYQVLSGSGPGRIIAGGSASQGVNHWPLGQSNSVIVAPTLGFRTIVNTPAAITRVENIAYFSEETGYIPHRASNQVTTDLAGKIGGRVWADLDGDGVLGSEELGLAGVTVQAAGDDNTARVTVSGGDGFYEFAGLTQGHYTVTVNMASAPEGYDFATTPSQQVFDLSTGQVIAAAYFGVKPPTTAVGDYIWYDANANGLQDVGEQGVGNVVVRLYRDQNQDGQFDPASDLLIDTTVSDAHGGYRLDAYVAGTYFVYVSDEHGLLAELTPTLGPQSNPTPSQPVALAMGDIIRNIDFGYVDAPGPGNGVIRDLLWLDGNRDGLRTQEEPGLTGVTVCATPTGGGAAICAPSDQNGRVHIEVPTGSYQVALPSAPFGLEATGLMPHALSVAAGEQHVGHHLGYALPAQGLSASVGGLVWRDVTVDGVFDADTESGLSDVSVNLIDDLDQDGGLDEGEPILATLTKYNGVYRFGALLSGAYIVAAPDTLMTAPHLGPTILGPNPHADNNNHLQPYAIQLASGQSIDTVDFGFRGYEVSGASSSDEGMIGNQLWIDVDQDGLFDPSQGDLPAPGVTVVLSQTGSAVAATTTGPDGAYLFTGLPLGGYTVAVLDQYNVLEDYVPALPGPHPGQDNNNQSQPYDLVLGVSGANLTADFAYQVIPPRARGDCNADDLVDAGDQSALVLEVFDGDGSSAANAVGGSFAGDPVGCDANVDAMIDAGDQSCLVLIAFGGASACALSGASGQAAPSLTIPQQIPAAPGASVSVPITFDNGGNSISSLFFSIDFDETLLTFDPTDSDFDGTPDAISFNVPAAFFPGVTYDASDTDGELDFTITDPAPPLAAMPNRVIATITFVAGSPPVTSDANVGFSATPGPSFGNTAGQSVAGVGVGGSVRIIASVNNTGVLGDRVWWDVNGNGQQDSGEPGIPGVSLALSGPAVGVATTDGSGVYSFTGLIAGLYSVTVSSGDFASGGVLYQWTASPQDVGSDATDSDGDPVNHRAQATLTGGQMVTTTDFGFAVASGYSVQHTLLTPTPARPGEFVRLRTVIRNTGASWLATVSLRETYQPVYLRFQAAQPSANDSVDDGQLDWSDLTNTFVTDLAPGASFVVTTTYLALADTGGAPGSATTINTLIHSVTADPDGPTRPLTALQSLGNQTAGSQVQVFSPTAVGIWGQVYAAEDGCMMLVWRTTSEATLIGFELYREIAGYAPTPLTSQLIPAKHSGSAAGDLYSYCDDALVESERARYLVRVFYGDGRTEWVTLTPTSGSQRLYLPLIAGE